MSVMCRIVGFLLVLMLFTAPVLMTSPRAVVFFTTETFTSSTTWTCPAGVTSVQVECWGGGGGGGGFGGDQAGGGGGGAYSVETALAVTPSSNYTVTVGTGGTGRSGANGDAGNDTWFSSTGTVLAKGGGGGGNVSGGAGGAAASGVGDTKFSGGNGSFDSSGGGGGGAGSGGNGGNASGTTGGTGTATGGGNGGNSQGGVGSVKGGGGAGSAGIGGSGARGEIILTYTAATPKIPRRTIIQDDDYILRHAALHERRRWHLGAQGVAGPVLTQQDFNTMLRQGIGTITP